ncbi:uncharacterized protein LOC133382900 [Rhineura floridana]|uniref:uncharacterized protein LOC133382900 n=1 Tax=Rhineura floridana TaxID=261503 RepID=UPI002AC80773|nr:uncharacterized protein LOC133382900 [Rhineura floridana]
MLFLRANSSFADGQPRLVSLHFPDSFHDICKAEWASLNKHKPAHKLVKKCFFSHQSVGTAENLHCGLASSCAILYFPPGKEAPEIHVIRERRLHCAGTLRLWLMPYKLGSGFCFCPGQYAVAAREDVLKHTKDAVKKMFLATAFQAEAARDAMQFSARAMVASTVPQCNIWLRSWEVNPRSRIQGGWLALCRIQTVWGATGENPQRPCPHPVLSGFWGLKIVPVPMFLWELQTTLEQDRQVFRGGFPQKSVILKFQVREGDKEEQFA